MGDDLHSSAHIVVASGATPRPLGIPGEDLVMTSEEFMAAERLGRRIVFIGGGYVSMEFAHVAAAAGSDRGRLPPRRSRAQGVRPGLAAMLVKAYREAGIDVRLKRR